jgi:hypothetical protein
MGTIKIRLCLGALGILLWSAVAADAPPAVDREFGYKEHYEELQHAKTLARAKQLWPKAFAQIKGENQSGLQCERYEMRLPQADIAMLKNAKSHKIIAASWGRDQSGANESVAMAIEIPPLKNQSTPMFSVAVFFEQNRCVMLAVDYSWKERMQ